MDMYEGTKALFDGLAKALGVDMLSADANGGVQLSVGDDSTVILFGEDDANLLVISPAMELPKQIDFGRTLWLLRRNFYDSLINPFRVSCDAAGSVVLWARLPIAGLTGEALATLIDALAEEADNIREEIEIDYSADNTGDDGEEDGAAA
jgi:hypothetical protein